VQPIPISGDAAPLPVAVRPDDLESGLGFLLRSATANGLSMQALMRWVGIKSPTSISASSIRALSYLTQVPAQWLAIRLVQRHVSKSGAGWQFLGRGWSSSASLRGSSPQVCPECLRERSRCLAAWEVSSICVCPKHRGLLVDQCAHCHRSLSWCRPSVDVCDCGHYLARPGLESIPTDNSILYVRSVHRAIAAPIPGESMMPGPDVPRWLHVFSADGLHCVIQALGVCGTVECRRYTGRRLPWTPAEAARVVDAGLLRAVLIDPANPTSILNLREVIYEPILDRLSARGATAADRDGAQGLVDMLTSPVRVGRSLTGRRGRGQLELFSRGAP
jgi:hypothetical protein